MNEKLSLPGDPFNNDYQDFSAPHIATGENDLLKAVMCKNAYEDKLMFFDDIDDQPQTFDDIGDQKQ